MICTLRRLLAYLAYFEKNKYKFIKSPCWMHVCVSPIKFRIPELISMKVGMSIMAPDPIAAAN
jgi:hypothetical protein